MNKANSNQWDTAGPPGLLGLLRKVCRLTWSPGFRRELPESLPSGAQAVSALPSSPFRSRSGRRLVMQHAETWLLGGHEWLARCEDLNIIHFCQRGLREVDSVLDWLDVRPCGKLNPQVPPTSPLTALASGQGDFALVNKPWPWSTHSVCARGACRCSAASS